MPASGVELDTALRERIAAALRTSMSPRHVPDQVLAVAAVPRTLSVQKLEVPVKKILTGTPPEQAAAEGRCPIRSRSVPMRVSASSAQ